jgi:nucleoside-diphosphate-sugar epimerase
VRVLLTGHDGYIGAVMAPFLQHAGVDVVGLDSYLFEECKFGPLLNDVPSLRRDVRDVEAEDLDGFDAVIHLAGISNDPLGNLNPELTYEINHRASVRLASKAKLVGVPRFIFASSCSLYGTASTDVMLTETASFNPVTAYGESKVLVERDVSELADDLFSPTFMRNATVYGVSPKLRVDLVVNNLVGFALLTGEVLILSDGTPWRPLVHVQDVCRAFLAVLEAPQEVVHNEAFNVGRNEENYQVRDVADIVAETVPDCRVAYAAEGGPDPRCYRVDFSKLKAALPDFRPVWDVRRGAQELYDGYLREGLTLEQFNGPLFMRVKHIQESMGQNRVNDELRRLDSAVSGK